MDGFSPSSLYDINHSNGIHVVLGEGTTIQATFRRECVGQRFCRTCCGNSQDEETEHGAKEIPKLDIPRNPRRICGIDPDDMDFVDTPCARNKSWKCAWVL